MLTLGSLSEASRIFDAERLKEIIGELGAQSQSFGLCEVFTAHKSRQVQRRVNRTKQ